MGGGRGGGYASPSHIGNRLNQQNPVSVGKYVQPTHGSVQFVDIREAVGMASALSVCRYRSGLAVDQSWLSSPSQTYLPFGAWLVEVLLYGHRNRKLIRDGEPRTATTPRLSHSS